MIRKFVKFVGEIDTLYKSIQKIKSNRMKEFGLGGTHAMCLCSLLQSERGLTAAELCKEIAIDKAAVSRALAELEEKDCIAYPEDGNAKRYRATAVLTPSGLEIARKISEIIREIVADVSGELSDDDRDGMYRSLDIISQNLKKLTQE